MLTLTALRDPEYLISSVALAIDEYYAGVGEAPGVWIGRFAAELGLEGVVDPDQLRTLVQGQHPVCGEDLLVGRPERKVNAFDATLSAPKGVSLLWALGSPEVSSVVTRCHVDAVERAVSFLEDTAAVARQQTKGVRRRVPTAGFAVATFVHRTSREGDPQLHSHCLIANVVRRPDGSHVAFDANPLHDWAKAAGSIYQAELQRLLSLHLGVEWGPERNGCREPVGFRADQLRAFSKRTVAIEAELERSGATYQSAAERMRADDDASLATRPRKDHSLTPTLLAERWEAEGRAVGLESEAVVEAAVVGRGTTSVELKSDGVVAGLLDPDTGLCANDARFSEAKVVERICAASAGRLTTEQILGLAEDFLASEHVVRLVPETSARRRPPEWSTVAHRQLENAVLERLARLVDTPAAPIPTEMVEAALCAEGHLGTDQAEAVLALCGGGAALRSLLAPAGFGKTTAVYAAASACTSAGRPVLGVATTNQAVAGLRSVGLEAMTLARLRIELEARRLAPGTVVVLDEVSQVATRDAAAVLEAVVATSGAQLWCLGDPRQSQAVGAGGLAAEVSRLGAEGAIVAPALVVNRRQRHVEDQRALAELRAGHAGASQVMRTEAGWEHEELTPLATREAIAEAVVADVEAHGPEAVVALAVSHADCEDLADRIRSRLIDTGHISGPAVVGPGWGSTQRSYAAGDRVLLHAKPGQPGLHNGSVGTVVAIDGANLRVAFDEAGEVVLPAAFVAGRRADGSPNLSHGWARTIEGAQGGTWEAVHLLAGASLDALVGYTGQSRGRAPTHTWNTRALAVVDYGGVVADDRSASEVVLAGLSREPVTTFAAHDDPWVLDAELSAERAEHLEVLEGAPPDRRLSLYAARDVAERAANLHASAMANLERAEDRLGGFGPLAGLRRSSRQDRAQVEAWVGRTQAEAEQADARRRAAERHLADLEAGERDRARFAVQHAWRAERVGAIDAELARHWNAATLGAVRQDDPLAFGVERLRAARTTYADDLHHLEAALPPDRTHSVTRAKQELAGAEQDLRQARFAAAEARRDFDIASQRHWGRRDKQALAQCLRAAERADDAVAAAAEGERDARGRLDAELAAQQKRARATDAVAPQRAELTQVLAEIDAALDDSRAARVSAIAAEPVAPAHLVAVLGEPPANSAGGQAWCGLAYRVESYRDRHPEALGHEASAGVAAAIGPRPGERWQRAPDWDDLAGQLGHGVALVAMAVEVAGPGETMPDEPSSWLELVHQAGRDLEPRTPTLERGISRDHGMELSL
ncbi:MAG TPA: MobF family relaxase [Acidimicrobiales bacterium]|nr:MobF family relaxase [Acidimicrobiales bacterium]